MFSPARSARASARSAARSIALPALSRWRSAEPKASSVAASTSLTALRVVAAASAAIALPASAVWSCAFWLQAATPRASGAARISRRFMNRVSQVKRLTRRKRLCDRFGPR
ncbi:hypothetical protein WR25_10673 [Diploscapter pachys]|uniref:Uncharacterized protein n=1 Tax=Diploscapter pachys TaxID=2018661 RepID=A0A2A2KHJ5_9BILA|nr:hypothetical protein WR25_10673 [Diploscapter pachys]